MTDPVSAAEPPRSYPRLKVLYLFAVSAAVFAVPAIELTRVARWYVVPALLVLQVLLLLVARVPPLDISRATMRLKWLFAFLIACYVFLPAGSGSDDVIYYWQPLPIARFIPLNLTGLDTASLMCLQIATVILVSAVVRLTGSSTDLVEGLRGFRLPRLFVHSIDMTLALLGGLERRGMGSGGGGGGGRGRGRGGRGGGGGGGSSRRGMGGGRGRGRARMEDGGLRIEDQRSDSECSTINPQSSILDPQSSAPPPPSALRRLLRGDVGFFVESIEQSLARARERVGREGGGGLDERLVHDVSVISGIALAMMSLKLLKVLPGLPFMPGWKTLFFYPLYILAAHLTYSRWGGTTAGTIMGVLGYMQGDGRYGALEILKHLVPGMVIDITWPVVRRLPRSAFVFCLLGFVAAIARTSTEFIIMLLFQARLEAYAFTIPALVSNMVAGTLSGMVTYFVLPAFRRPGPSTPEQLPAVAGEATTPTTDSPTADTRLAKTPHDPT